MELSRLGKGTGRIHPEPVPDSKPEIIDVRGSIVDRSNLSNSITKGRFVMHVCSVILFALSMFQTDARGNLDVQDLIDVSLSGNSFHSIDVDIDMSAKAMNLSIFPGTPPPEKKYALSWIVTPTSERIQCVNDFKPNPKSGDPTNINDFLRNAEGVKLLRNYDFHNPQVLTPVHQGTVYAEILPTTAELPPGFMDPGCILLQRFEFLAGKDRRTLRELVLKDCSNAQVITTTRPNLIALKITQVNTNGRPTQNHHIFYFDPVRNYAIKRLETHVVNDTSISKEAMNFVRETVVEDYHDGADEVSIPKVVIQTTRNGATIQAESRFTIQLKSVNQPIDKSRTEFDFPEHALVRTSIPEERRFKAQLWGVNGPVIEVKDKHDLVQYWGKDDPLEQPASPGPMIMLITALLAITFLGLWLYRRTKTRVS